MAEVILLFCTTISTWTGPYCVCTVEPLKVPLTVPEAPAAGAAAVVPPAAGAADWAEVPVPRVIGLVVPTDRFVLVG